MHREPVDQRVQPLGLVAHVQRGSCLAAGTEQLDGLATQVAHPGVRLVSQPSQTRIDARSRGEGQPDFEDRSSLRVEDEQALQAALHHVSHLTRGIDGCDSPRDLVGDELHGEDEELRLAGKDVSERSLRDAGLGCDLPDRGRLDPLAQYDTPQGFPSSRRRDWLTTIDLRRGGEAALPHALAAVYIGVSVAWGQRLVSWADVRFAHRFAGGPPPERPPRTGRRHAARQRREWLRHLVAWAAGTTLLGLGVLAVGDLDRSWALLDVAALWTLVLAVDFLVAFSYTLWPRRREPGDGGAAVPAPPP
jgi:hypothetical protein